MSKKYHRAALAVVAGSLLARAEAALAIDAIDDQGLRLGSVGLNAGAGSSIGDYLATAHQMGVIAVAALAVVMVAWGAVEVMSESFFKKTDGRARIWNAILGLLLALGSVVILQTISTSFRTTSLDSLGRLGSAAKITAGNQTAPGGPGGGTGNRPGEGESTNGPRRDGDWADVNTVSEIVAWRRVHDDNMSYEQILAEGGFRNADGSYSLPVRVTRYSSGEANSDADTDAGNGIFGSLRTYTGPGTYGSAAVDSSVVPFGSIVRVNNNGTTQWYVAEDVGGAVINRQSTGGSRPVVDVYTGTDHSWGGNNQTVTVFTYTGTTPYANLTRAQQQAYLDSLNYSD